MASLDTSCGETWKAWDELSQSTPPDVALERMCSLFRHAALRVRREPPSIAREVSAKPKPAQAEILARARATKAECSKLHRGLNQLRRDVTRDLGRLHHELSLAAAPGRGGGGGGGGGGGSPAHSFTPIGHIESCFLQKNGTPRQAGLAGSARARLRVRCGTNPSHALEGLENFSHVWLLWVFDRNGGEVSMLQLRGCNRLCTRGCDRVQQRLQPCASEAVSHPYARRWGPAAGRRDLVRPLPPGSQGQGAPPAALRRGYGALRVPDAAPTLPARPLARRTARHAPRLQRCAAAAIPPPQAATPGAQAATPRAQACAATSCCSVGLTWSTVRPCSTSSRALQPLTRRAHTWGCSLWHAGLQPLTNWAAASSTHGVLGVKPRVPRADTPARVHMLMRAWAAWSVLHVKTHRYVPSADTPTSAVRVPPWLVAGGEAAPPPRQVTITAEASSVSSAAPPTTTAASTTC